MSKDASTSFVSLHLNSGVACAIIAMMSMVSRWYPLSIVDGRRFGRMILLSRCIHNVKKSTQCIYR
jgi:hypothetical protein